MKALLSWVFSPYGLLGIFCALMHYDLVPDGLICIPIATVMMMVGIYLVEDSFVWSESEVKATLQLRDVAASFNLIVMIIVALFFPNFLHFDGPSSFAMADMAQASISLRLVHAAVWQLVTFVLLLAVPVGLEAIIQHWEAKRKKA